MWEDAVSSRFPTERYRTDPNKCENISNNLHPFMMFTWQKKLTEVIYVYGWHRVRCTSTETHFCFFVSQMHDQEACLTRITSLPLLGRITIKILYKRCNQKGLTDAAWWYIISTFLWNWVKLRPCARSFHCLDLLISSCFKGRVWPQLSKHPRPTIRHFHLLNVVQRSQHLSSCTRRVSSGRWCPGCRECSERTWGHSRCTTRELHPKVPHWGMTILLGLVCRSWTFLHRSLSKIRVQMNWTLSLQGWTWLRIVRCCLEGTSWILLRRSIRNSRSTLVCNSFQQWCDSW